MGIITNHICEDCLTTTAHYRESEEKALCDKCYTKYMWWECKYCGLNEHPNCIGCTREDGKPVTDELIRD